MTLDFGLGVVGRGDYLGKLVRNLLGRRADIFDDIGIVCALFRPCISTRLGIGPHVV